MQLLTIAFNAPPLQLDDTTTTPCRRLSSCTPTKEGNEENVKNISMNVVVSPAAVVTKIVNHAQCDTFVSCSMHEANIRRTIAHLQSQRQKLLASTPFPPPPFSWHMPYAQHRCPQIQSFLRCPEQCKTLIVGGGVCASRELSGCHRCETFSAHIQATRATGRNASVIVMKTREYHKNIVSTYDFILREVHTLDYEIRLLGGTLAAPEFLAVAEHEQRPVKKQKVGAPMPIGAEIITILDD